MTINKNILQFSIEKQTQFNAWLRGFQFKDEAIHALPKHEFDAACFLALSTPLEFSLFFDLSIQELEVLINSPKYIQYKIAKKKGGERAIDAPEASLKKVQKRLNHFLQAYYHCIKPANVHGFVTNPNPTEKTCNILDNALVHVGKKYVLNIDLKDFFPSISARKVKALFSSNLFVYDEQLALALTLLTTYEGKLPTGAPTSPVISNFICLNLDESISQLCAANKVVYSRYADDLSFSSDEVFTTDFISAINKLIHENDFALNPKKFRLKAANKRQAVTGLTVNDKVNVDRRFIKKTRAMLHDLTSNGITIAAQRHFTSNAPTNSNVETLFLDRLNGYINFIGQIRGRDDALFLKMKRELGKSIW
jgi:RNA-directed DNA polymerase